MFYRFISYLVLLSAWSWLGCGGPTTGPAELGRVMVRIEKDKWPALTDDLEPSTLGQALEQSRVYLRRLPPEHTFNYGTDSYTAGHLLRSLDVFEKLFHKLGPGPAFTRALKENFILYRSVGSNGKGEVLFTGYYEPLLNGSPAQSEQYRWPLYQRPGDLIAVDLGRFIADLSGKKIQGRLEGLKLVPYYSRQEIDRQGALAGRNLELAWVDDPVALFFLHIQGSGRLQYPDGTVVRVGYDGANGRPYRSLGKLMLSQKLLKPEEMSMQGLRDWLRAHPEAAPGLMDANESYVFFRFLEGEAVGNINVPLTAGRSVALDYRIFPKGALAWIKGRQPRVEGNRVVGLQDFSRFVMIQDTGGAIRGPGRLDLFHGFGLEAELAAGHQKETGELYLPVLKP